jgi:hypothetical protein
LAGCAANPPSQTYLAINSMLEAGKMRTQYRSDLDSADFAPIRGRVDLAESFERGLPACTEASLDGYPTPEEQTALRRWAELRTAYLIGLDALQVSAGETSRATAPVTWRISVALAKGRQDSTRMIADLIDGRLTYCQFATRDRNLPYVAERRTQPLIQDYDTILTAAEPVQPLPAIGATQATGGNPYAPGATVVIQNGQVISPNTARQH